MLNLSATAVQHICCDATSVNLPEKVSFFYKSSFHNTSTEGRVRVDFSLNVKGTPVAYFGIWRFRVSFWLPKEISAVTYEEGFEYYKSGFRIALEEAEKFVSEKYRVHSIMPPPTDAELLEKYKAFGAKKDGDTVKAE
jgi:hypothetical protein